MKNIIVFVLMLLLVVGGVEAKDSQPTVLPTTNNCSDQFGLTENGQTIYYPLAHDLGTVGVNINMLTGIPRIDNVCLSNGWTATGGNVSGGIQLSFAYLGKNKIDFKYVLGKTDIKFR